MCYKFIKSHIYSIGVLCPTVHSDVSERAWSGSARSMFCSCVIMMLCPPCGDHSHNHLIKSLKIGKFSKYCIVTCQSYWIVHTNVSTRQILWQLWQLCRLQPNGGPPLVLPSTGKHPTTHLLIATVSDTALLHQCNSLTSYHIIRNQVANERKPVDLLQNYVSRILLSISQLSFAGVITLFPWSNSLCYKNEVHRYWNVVIFFNRM